MHFFKARNFWAGVSSLLAAFLAAGCAHPPEASTVIDLDIAEAGFRYQFDHNESSQQKSARAYCIGLIFDMDGKARNFALTADFLARFAGNVPRVRSRCTSVPQDGIEFRINSVACKDKNACEAKGGYYEASESASGNIYYLEKHAGKWVVVRDVMEWIS